MAEGILIAVSIILLIIAVPLVYFLFKKLGHGIKHLFFAVITCIMLTSLIQLGIFYSILKFKIFEVLCSLGLDCNSLFSGFVKLSIFSSIAIFAILISIYYIFKILKGIFKIAIVIIGIILIVIACIIVYKSYVPNNSIMPDVSICSINEDCIIIQDNGNASAMNKKYIEGRLEDSPNSLNASLDCMYRPVCVANKCHTERKENVSVCGNF
jgi:hypothetical protein